MNWVFVWCMVYSLATIPAMWIMRYVWNWPVYPNFIISGWAFLWHPALQSWILVFSWDVVVVFGSLVFVAWVDVQREQSLLTPPVSSQEKRP